MDYQLTFRIENCSKKLLSTIDKQLTQNCFAKDGKTYLIAQSDKIKTCDAVKEKFKQIVQGIVNIQSQTITAILTILSEPRNAQGAKYDDFIEKPITIEPSPEHK